jgi:hypothetical protein
MTAAGVYIASEGLADASLGRWVPAAGPHAAADGAGGELAGFYLIDCLDLDDAVAWAGRVPGADGVEVRPVLGMGGSEF